MPATAAPLREKNRIHLLDCLRGLALLGILLMNAIPMSMSYIWYDKMDLSQPITGPNFWAWAGQNFLFEGTMRGLFSILFGAGTLLLLSKLTKKNQGLEPADIYYRRMLWLLLFGLINAFLFMWPGDILYPYAICGLLLFPFRNLNYKNLLLIAFGLLLIGTYRENSDLYAKKSVIAQGQAIEVLKQKNTTLTEKQQEQLTAYEGVKAKTTYAGLVQQAKADEKHLKDQSWGTRFQYLVGINMMIQSTYFYKQYWFDILLFFFLGMALFKSGFLSGKKSHYIYAGTAVVGIFSGFMLNYFYHATQYRLGFDQFTFIQQWEFSYYEIRRVFQTMGYLSLLILLYKFIPFRKIMNVVAPVGRMAFTNYLSQSLIMGAIFYGFNYWGKLQRFEVYYVVASVWLFQIIFSHLWLHYFHFGPFEWVWRSLTYLKKQPMRKVAAFEDTDEEQEQMPAPAIA